MADEHVPNLSDLLADLICEAGEDRDDGRGTYLHIDPDLAAERMVQWLEEHDHAVAAAAWEEGGEARSHSQTLPFAHRIRNPYRPTVNALVMTKETEK